MVVANCWTKAHWDECYYYVSCGSQATVKMDGAYFRLAEPLVFQGGWYGVLSDVG